jgi:hypothetical protein
MSTAPIPDMLAKVEAHDWPEAKRAFITDFCANVRKRKRGPSDRQIACLARLFDDITRPQADPIALPADDVTKLQALLKGAKARGLKNPAISLDVDGVAFRLSLAPDHGRNPGAIYVKSEAVYLGKITDAFHPARECTAEDVTLLSRFACDPAGIAARHGHETGSCCFCNRPLDDARSTKVGYGPVCATRYDLPWG